MSKLNQTLLKFELEQNFAYDDYFVSKCNYFAFNLMESWPKWEKNILNIYGEKFSGKSHLSEIFKKKYKAIIIKNDEINEEFFKKIRFHENIILDNLQYIHDENILYSIFNFVEQFNKYLIINSIDSINSIDFSLPDLKSRFKNCIFAKIEKILDEIDLIEKYYISFFDNEITRYSILSNSTPDKLINEFEKFDVKITIKNNIWYLNE